MLRIEQPHVRLQCRDGGYWALPAERYDEAKSTLMRGAAFYEAVDLWGDPCVVKIADVVGLSLRTAEGMVILAEEAEERARRKLTGEDDHA